VDLDRQIGVIDGNIYGEFICRRPGCSEGGLYDPRHPSADEDGLRKDVVEAIRGLKPPLIRWPGGCTGTSYNWIDGVGPVEERPKKIDLHFGWSESECFNEPSLKLEEEPYLDLSATLDPKKLKSFPHALHGHFYPTLIPF